MQTCHQAVKEGSFGSNNRKGYCKIHPDNMLGKQSPKNYRKQGPKLDCGMFP
ncbi:hypothetical protein RHGRI_020628 [Rhododendron griersonianum]|uniref:Uncharacterized protein n=1 Tax=Rhododendron griersonianum TaxID=479676 RepID=A0AAV6JKC2_9ERIC|nr:hypothetical protein RHGRI_020628 [Rhododendron griersonianum]